jgi:hypothetical protein
MRGLFFSSLAFRALFVLSAPCWASISLIRLHAPDGYQIEVNTNEISSVRQPREGHFAEGVRCTLIMTNRSFISVREPCDVVRQMLFHPDEHDGPPCVYVCGEARKP